MATCQADNLSQIFTYESPSRRIIIDGKCLNYNPITNNVYPRECHEEKNQKWHYNSVTKEIRTLFDEKCLDMSSSKNIYMYPCHGGANQKFFLPSSWDMTPSPVSELIFSPILFNGPNRLVAQEISLLIFPLFQITARKVRLEKTGDFISLAEVEVYDEANINVALGKATSQTSTFQSAVASMGVDGDISGNQGTLFMTLDRGCE